MQHFSKRLRVHVSLSAYVPYCKACNHISLLVLNYIMHWITDIFNMKISNSKIISKEWFFTKIASDITFVKEEFWVLVHIFGILYWKLLFLTFAIWAHLNNCDKIRQNYSLVIISVKFKEPTMDNFRLSHFPKHLYPCMEKRK